VFVKKPIYLISERLRKPHKFGVFFAIKTVITMKNPAENGLIKLKKFAVFMTVISYLYLCAIFIFKKPLEKAIIDPIYIAWIPGICCFVLNLILSLKINLNKGLVMVLILSGLVWALPLLIYSLLGIPMLAIYLVVIINLYRHKLPTTTAAKSVSKKSKRS
jgi:hypothetical protein